MSWKRSLFFLFLLIAVASFYYFKVRQQYSAETPFSFSTESAKMSVLSLAGQESVDHLTLRDTSKESEISFQKTKGHNWRITRPVDYPAEFAIVDGFAALLKLSPRIRQFSTEGLSLSEFGFNAPRLSICISTNQRPNEKCLLIGSDAVAFKGAYAKWIDESKYFLVDANFVAAFDKTLYSVRKKQVFLLTDQEISSVHFRSSEHEYEIKHQRKQWWLEKPLHAGVGIDAVNSILVYLSGIYVKEFLDTELPEHQKFGLKQPARIIEVTSRDGSKQTLIQGREAPGQDAYYAQGSDGRTVLLISFGKLNKLEDAFKALTS